MCNHALMSTTASAKTLAYIASTSKSAEAAPVRKTRRNVLLASLMGLLLVGSVTAYFLLRSPAPTGKPAEVAKFVTSDAFDRLSPEKQQAYFDAIEENRDAYRDLPEEQRRQLREVVGQARENKELDRFAKMTPAEQKKYVDERVKEEEERRKRWEGATTRPAGQGGPGGPGGPGGGRGPGGGGRFTPERMKARLENQSPQRRATQALLRSMIAERRAQLGLPQGGGRGGGWGGGRGR